MWKKMEENGNGVRKKETMSKENGSEKGKKCYKYDMSAALDGVKKDFRKWIHMKNEDAI